MKKILCAAIASAGLAPLFTGSASAQISAFPPVDLSCYMIDQAGYVTDLELVCNPDALAEAELARRRAAEAAEIISEARAAGLPLACNFVMEQATRRDVEETTAIDIPVVCVALRDARDVGIGMQLRANGNQLIGDSFETVNRILAEDSYSFKATFIGDYIPPIDQLEVTFEIDG